MRRDPDPCAPGGACVNGENTYTCACSNGFTFDGQTCFAALTGTGTADTPRYWTDGTLAASCQEYRFPPAPYRYQGATGDGFYAIAPPGRGLTATVFCDMTTDGGGWNAIDPAAGVAFGGVARVAYAEATINTCQVRNGLFEAFYRNGNGPHALVCQYDIDLGITFDTIRLSNAAGDRLEIISLAVPGNTSDLTNALAHPWGQNIELYGTGDVVLGGASGARPVLRLGVVLGLASGSFREFSQGAIAAWPVVAVVTTTASTTLRIQLSESGTQEEGWRWSAGRLYVRHDATLPAPPAAAARPLTIHARAAASKIDNRIPIDITATNVTRPAVRSGL